MESTIERQAIRAAVALAATSSHARSPEIIADLRDESAQLMRLCVHSASVPRDLLSWCDDAAVLLQQLVAADALPDEHALFASAAVLRLRLAVTRVVALDAERSSKKITDQQTEKRRVAEPVKKEPVKLSTNLQAVTTYIREHRDARAKDIIGTLSGKFSSRSIKRYLSELVALHVVSRRDSDDGGVMYSLKD